MSFEDGVRLFNEREFWHAHEAWEELWLEEDDDDRVLFYQGLIQLAAAYHHMKRGTFPGAVRLFEASLQQAQANYQAAEGNLVKAEAQERDAGRQFERSRSLLERKLIAQADYDTSQANQEVMKGQLPPSVGGLGGQRVELFGRSEALFPSLNHHLFFPDHVHEFDPN